MGGGSLFAFDDLDALLVSGQTHTRLRFSCTQSPECFTVSVRGTKGVGGEGSVPTFLGHPRTSAGVRSQLAPLANQAIRGLALTKSAVTAFWKKAMQVTPYEGLATFLDRTCAALVSGGPPPVCYEDMRGTAALIDALVEARDESPRMLAGSL